MNTLMQILVGLVIALLVAILAVPFFIDWNQYKGEIEAQASKILGRELQVAGDVQLRMLPAPYLRLENIKVVSPGNEANTPTLLKAEAFRFWLAAPPLLRGVVVVEEIELIKPTIRVAFDKDGKSNWSRLSEESKARLPFVPKSVSLQSMRIIDGALQVTSADIADRSLSLNNLNGGFSAGSLTGPYKFDGTIGKKGADQKTLRISTGRIDEKGGLRLKSIMHVPERGYRYGFDGDLRDLYGHPALSGVLSASFPFLTKPDTDKNSRRVQPLEVKAGIKANASKATFDQLLVTVVHKNRPQMMTGEGRITWQNGKIDFDGKIGSRLVDLDHLKDGMAFGNSVSQTIGSVIDRLKAQTKYVDSGRVRLKLGQIKLNSDLIQEIDFLLERDDSGLSIRKLTANLPGGNRLRLNGRFGADSGKDGFIGSCAMLGQNLGRLVTWSAGGSAEEESDAISARPFTLRGDIILSDQKWALNNARGDIADTAFSGELIHQKPQKGQQGKIKVRLVTGEIDTTALVGRPLAMGEIIGSVLTRNKKNGDKRNRIDQFLGDNTLKLELRAGRLKLADFTGQDLVADLYYGLNRLDIAELSLRSPEGLHIHADGRIDDLETNPSGSVAGLVNIESGNELNRFLSWFKSSKKNGFGNRQLAALTPLRLAVMLDTDKQKGANALVRVNGVAGSSRIGFNNRIIARNLFSRREPLTIQQMEITGTASNQDGAVLLTQLLPYLPVEQEKLQSIGKSKLWFSASGLPEKGLDSRLEFSSPRITAGFDGNLGWEEGLSRFTGKAHLKTDDLASGLALVGLTYDQQQLSGGMQLSANIDKQKNNFTFSNIDGKLGSSEIQGRGTFEQTPQEHKLDLVLLASRLELPHLFTPILEKGFAGKLEDNLATVGQVAQQVGPSSESTNGSPQPSTIDALVTNRAFDPKLLQNVNADILITADQLTLADDLMLTNAELSTKIKDRTISLTRLGGKLWGGEMKLSGTLDMAATIVKLDGELEISNANIDQAPLQQDGQSILSGQMFLKSKFSGRGINPAGLLSLMNGSGNLKVLNGKINHFNGSVLDDIVDDELAIWDQTEDKTPFQIRFKRHLFNADQELQEFNQPFTIADGIAELKSTGISGDIAKIDMDINVTLATLATNSRLTLSPLAAAKHTDLPPAGIVFNGPLPRIDQVIAKFDTASLEQHLKVMKMEHDVEILEKLHKQDEEIARKNAERRNQNAVKLEEEAAAAGEQPAIDGNINGDGNQKEAPAPTINSPSPNITKPRWNPFSEQFDSMR